MPSPKKTSVDAVKLIQQQILEVFKIHSHKHYNYKQVLKKLEEESFAHVTEQLFNAFDEGAIRNMIITSLEKMTESGDLIETDRGKYKLFPVEHFVEGKIDITSSGSAYVVNDQFEDDIYIARQSTMNAMHGDKVKVSLYAQRKGKRPEGEVIEVLERARTEFAGIVQVSGKFAFLSSEGQRGGVDIFIPLSQLNGAVNGEKAIARITDWPQDAKNPIGEIIKVLGMPGDNNAEMDAILIEFGFPLSFPPAVEDEASAIPDKIAAKEIAARRDFRKTITFTIDPADAKDFDDALSIQTLPNGNYEIGVHIADVSHYVVPGTELDREGLERATSIYLVDRVIPMLPEKLSNHVCSLRPGEDKLCYSAVFEMNDKAEVLKEWFGRTIIHSQKRFSYEEAQAVIETGDGPLKTEILTFQRLAQLLRKERFKQGAITFEKVEVKFQLDEKGYPVDVYIKESKDSNKLIEEFMLLANRKVAEFIGKNHAQRKEKAEPLPFVYRVHDTPVEDRMTTFAAFAGKFGYRINTKSDREIAHSLNNLMKEVKGKKEQNVLEQLAIRTMSKAIYTTDNIGHYGLSFDYYTHFTSPIRRYPDVMVHRLLDHYLKGGKPAAADILEKQCQHSTDMEIKASEAERASIKFKQVQYLLKREGEVFDGIISGVTEWGIYIELTYSKCEGMIRMRDLKDDFYEFDDKNYCIVGHKTRKKYQLGDAVKVVLKSADLLKKQIDFVIFDEFGPNPIRAFQSKGGFDKRSPANKDFNRSSGKNKKSKGGQRKKRR
jgi:ribonuclease R